MAGRTLVTWRAALLATAAWVGLPAAPAAIFGAGEARAQATPARTFSFDIGPRPLAQALNDFARVTGQSVVFTQAEAAGAQSPGVRGTMSADQALAAITAGTGWTWQRTNAGTVTLAQAQGAVALPEVRVQAGLIPPTATIGAPPPPYPGGQVASGQRLGLLGNRTVFETPFAVQSLTRELIENTQVSRVAEVATFNPSVRINNPIGGTEVLNLTIRGFALGNSSFQFDGFPGVAPARAGTLEGIERIELILGPSGLLTGVPRFGEPGGSLNLVPMRATDSPITRTTAFFLSEGTIGGRVDVGRRYGPNNEWGVRTNLAYSNGRGLTESSHNEFAAITFGTDYRGERFRWSGDFVHNRQRSDGMQQAVPGFPYRRLALRLAEIGEPDRDDDPDLPPG